MREKTVSALSQWAGGIDEIVVPIMVQIVAQS
jgi:hypothetical protein